MKEPALILSSENGRSISLSSTISACTLGRVFFHREFGLTDPTISRDHCQIRWKGRNFWIRDGSAEGVSSLVGTVLDGWRLPASQWVPIPHRASLRIGGTLFSVCRENAGSTEYDIMISYSRKDEKAVLGIHDSMQNLGLRPWLDQKSHQPATHYKKEIEKVMTEVSAVAVFWGGDHMGDTHAAELEIVTDLHIHKRLQSLFLVVLPESENPEWGLFLNNIDYYDLRKAGEFQRLMDDFSKKLLSEKNL